MKKDVILKVGAAPCEWEVIEQIAETCTTDGKVVKKCKVHGETSTTLESASGHEWSRWKVTKNATVLAEGVQQRSCSVCGKTETASVAKFRQRLLSMSKERFRESKTVLYREG